MKLAFPRYSTGAVILLVLLVAYTPSLLDRGTARRWTREDRLSENLGALGLLATSVLFLASGFRWSRVTRIGPRAVLCCLLSGVFLVGFLEEVSWGQRFFGLKTPNALVQ